MANKSISRIEGILQYYTKALGDDYNAYRNHVYRVYHMSIIYFNKEIDAKEEELFSIACTFHDLGKWTHHTMDYISRSADLAENYMSQNGLRNTDTVKQMIIGHHSIRPNLHDRSEALRKADLLDLTFGKIRSGLPHNLYLNILEEFPTLNFQKKMFIALFKYALRHPLRPFPMIKK